MFLLQGGRQHVHVCPRAGYRRARPQPGESREVAAFADHVRTRHAKRLPEIRSGLREPKTGRHHSHNGPRLLIHLNRAAQDVGIAAITPLPQLIAEDHHLFGVGQVLVRGEPAAQDGFDVDQFEKPVRDDEPVDLFGFAIARQAGGGFDKRGDPLEGVVAIAPLQKIQGIDDIRFEATRTPFPDHYQAIGFLERKALQHGSVYHAENGCVGADTERQSESRDQRKAGAVPQLAQGVAGILQEIAGPRDGAALAARVGGQSQTAGVHKGGATSLRGTHAGAQIVLNAHLQVSAEFFGEFVFAAVAVKQSGYA